MPRKQPIPSGKPTKRSRNGDRRIDAADAAPSSATNKRTRVARNAPPVDESPVAVDSVPRPLVPRRGRPAMTPTRRLASRELLDALGGPQATSELLRLSGKPKAHRLADLLDDPKLEGHSFQHKLTQASLSIGDFAELLLEIRGARALARIVTSADEVAESIIRQATDQIVEHKSCLASGRILDEQDGVLVATDVECFDCDGSGYIVQPADPDAVDRYLELIRLRKNAPLLAITKNTMNQNLNVAGDLVTGDGVPQIDSIIRRADQQMLPPPSRTLTDGSERLPAMVGMPEDAVEAEVVQEST